MPDATITNIRSARQLYTRGIPELIRDVPDQCVKILIEIVDSAPGFNPTYDLLASRLGCSRRSIYLKMALLQETGCISREGTDSKNRIIWCVNKPEDRAAAAKVYAGEIVQTTGATSDTSKGATSCTQLGATSCTPNLTKNYKAPAPPKGGRLGGNKEPKNHEPGPPPRIDKPAILPIPGFADLSASLRISVNNKRKLQEGKHETPLSPT